MINCLAKPVVVDIDIIQLSLQYIYVLVDKADCLLVIVLYIDSRRVEGYTKL